MMVLSELYTQMALIRAFETRVAELYRDGEIPGFVHTSLGQEAVAVGVCAALRDDDYLATTHRGHGHVLAKGADLDGMMCELFAKATGLCGGKGGSMHVADPARGILGANAIVGASMPLATGAGLSSKLLGQDRVAVAFFGDGAVNQGTFHESLNLAAIWNLPVLFVCENNQFATSTRLRDSTAGTITGRAEAFGIPAETIDGMDPEAVLAAASGAVARARAGDGPAFLECLTYRFDAHHTWEHIARPRYRSDEEVAAGSARDPLEIQAARVPAAVRARIDGEIEDLLDQAQRFVDASGEPDPAGALDHLYAGGLRGRAGTA
jgi:pyruvate dehydrogenase E1 component alpha subunit